VLGQRYIAWLCGVASSGNVRYCRCDTRSHLARELADWRAGYVGRVVPGACSRPAPPCRALPVTAGCGAQGKPKGLPSHPVGYRRGAGRTGESREPSLMPRKTEPRWWDAGAGCRDWPLRSGRRWPGTASGQEEHRRPRGREGTQPGRISQVRNVETPSGSGRACVPGKPTVRKAQVPGGNRMTREANAGGRKAAGNRDEVAGPFCWLSWITGRIPGGVPGPERALTRVR